MRIYNCILIVLCVSARKNQISKEAEAAFPPPSPSPSPRISPAAFPRRAAGLSAGLGSSGQTQPRAPGKAGPAARGAAAVTAAEMNAL